MSPIKGTTGPVSTAKIVDGTYRVDAKGGVPIGAHRVEIKAYMPKPGAKPLPPGAGAMEGNMPKQQYLPAQYNSRSQLELVVPPENSTLEQDYELID